MLTVKILKLLTAVVLSDSFLIIWLASMPFTIY